MSKSILFKDVTQKITWRVEITISPAPSPQMATQIADEIVAKYPNLFQMDIKKGTLERDGHTYHWTANANQEKAETDGDSRDWE